MKATKTKLTSDRSAPRSEAVFVVLRNRILRHEYPAGYSLTELEVARELKVSRTPIREALRRLDHEQLVRLIPRKGAMVKSVSSEDIREAYLIRQALEGICARRAAELASEESLRLIEQGIGMAREHLAQGRRNEASEAADELHRVILNVGGTPRVRRMVASLRELTSYLHELALSLSGRLERSIEEHAAVFEALRSRDPARAEQLMREHIASTERDALNAHQNRPVPTMNGMGTGGLAPSP